MTYSFGAGRPGSDEAEALKELLLRPEVYEAQRIEGSERVRLANLDYSSCFIWVYWRTVVEPAAAILFEPQKCGLWEMHVAARPEIKARTLARGIVPALETAFKTGSVKAVAAPCPDWNPAINKFARMMRNRLPEEKRSGISWYGVPLYARRDDRTWSAIVFLILAEKFMRKPITPKI